MVHLSESGRVERKRARRRSEILDAALEVLRREGFDALTIGRLARELDCANGALYRYFDGKDALIAALQTRVIAHVGEALREARGEWAVRLPRGGARAALCELAAVADFYAQLPVRLPRVFELVAITLAEPRPLVSGEPAQAVAVALQEVLAQVAARVQAAVDAGALGPGDALQRTVVLWSTMQGLAQMRKLERLAPAVLLASALVPAAVRTLLLGWGADGEHVEQALAWLAETNVEVER